MLERIGSRSSIKGQEFAREFSCPKFGSYEDVLEDDAVDAVYISTPAALHEEWIKRAADHKKHVLCEKPAVMSYGAARECAALCEKKGVTFVEAYSFKYHPQHDRVRGLTSRIGYSRFFEGQFTYPLPKEGDIRLDPALGGGVFFDSAGYPVSAALMFLKEEPLSVCASLYKDDRATVDSAVAIQLNFPKSVAQLSSGFGLHYRSRYSILGTEGRVEAERAFSILPDRTTTILFEARDETETIRVEPADQFRLMVQSFVTQAREPGATRMDSEMLRLHRVMDAAWRSHAEGRIVTFAEYTS